jgi:hypothetical protein
MPICSIPFEGPHSLVSDFKWVCDLHSGGTCVLFWFGVTFDEPAEAEELELGPESPVGSDASPHRTRCAATFRGGRITTGWMDS